MELLIRCLRSYSRGERIVSLLAFLVLCASSWVLFIPKAEGDIYQAYHEASVGEILRLNPLYTDYNPLDADISALLFASLIKYDPYSQEFKSDLASYTVSEDALQYTFTLKNDLEWEDGEEITARDIVFTFKDVIQDPEFENKLLQSNFSGVELEVLNDLTVVFTLTTPNQFFLSNFTRGLLPYHQLKNEKVSRLDSVAWNKKPLASGPYRVYEPMTEDENAVQSILLTINENYYGEAPEIKTIKFFAFPTFDDLVQNRSMWHAVARVPFEKKDPFEKDPNLQLLPYTVQSYMAIYMNTDKEFLTNRNVRKAFVYAFPKETFYKMLPESSYLDVPVFPIDIYKNFKNSNKEEAEKALADLDISDHVFTLIRRDFTYDDPILEKQWKEWLDVYQQDLESLGLQVKIEALPLLTLQKRVKERDYDLLLYGQNLGLNADLFAFWHSSQSNSDGLNLSNYQNPKVDALIEALRSEKDPKMSDWESLASSLNYDAPAIFLYLPTYYYVSDIKVNIPLWQKMLDASDRFYGISNWSFKS